MWRLSAPEVGRFLAIGERPFGQGGGDYVHSRLTPHGRHGSPRLRHTPPLIAQLALSMTLCLAPVGLVGAQGVDLANRPITEVRIEGLSKIQPQLVRNQLRVDKGSPYDPKAVESDVVRVTRLGRFASVTARVEPQADGSVILTYVVAELPLLSDVQVVGNKVLSDQKLLALAGLRAGDPADPFLIRQASLNIKQEYERKGHFQADISADQELLDESNILILRVREGPLARIRDIKFEGNAIFDGDQLKSKIESQSYFPLFRKGRVDREQLGDDASRLREFYRDQGYLDAQVGRQISLSPDQKDAVITFTISEGPQFTVDQIRVEGNELFSEGQILQAMVLKAGDVLTGPRITKTQEAVTDLYGKLGFIDAKIVLDRLFHENSPKVDVVVRIDEGYAYNVGRVQISGNLNTQDKVVIRQVRGMDPGKRFDRSGIATTERRIKETGLFSDAKVTVLDDTGDVSRDVLIDVKEGQTGNLGFGAGLSSDLGIIGSIDMTQRNFDITDTPESAGEFFTGRAFRGAGQTFNLALQPGNEQSRYAVSFGEPYLLDSDFFLNTNLQYFQRDRSLYTEERVGGSLGVGHRFGDVWSASVNGRVEHIAIDDIEPDAPVDVFAVEGSSLVDSTGLSVVRDTTDSRIFPTRGSRLEMSISRAGLLGDYDFSMVGMEFHKFWTVDEDFFGYRTVVKLRSQIAYIIDGNAPIFERLYAGGHRTFRGFEYRGAGPRGIRNDTGTLGDEAVGGDWLFLLGLEYNFPIYEDLFRAVVFSDTGTVQSDLGLDEYRVSIGAGIRLKLPFLGQAPFALDLAFPLIKQDGDQTQFVSFDLALPF